MELYRERVEAVGFLRADEVQYAPVREHIQVAGLIVCRQRPPTAKGVVFISLLDETGLINIIVRPDVYEHYRTTIRGAALIAVMGVVERNAGVTHILAERIGALEQHFRAPPARNFR
jgi:error-prone DNA polymerase